MRRYKIKAKDAYDLKKEVEEYGAATRAYIDREMDFLRQDLPSELTIFPSATSYLLMQLPAPWQA